MPTKRKPVTIGVEEVKNAPQQVSEVEELKYLVKLDTKRFEARNMEQVINLIRGSEGVVSKITIERQ